MPSDDHKRQAAESALNLVESGMTLGLGTGSTAEIFIELLARKVKDGLRVSGVPTSEATKTRAEAAGIPLTTLDDSPFLDLAIDGADEIDDELRLIKGGGGALLREKIVAAASDRLVVIADRSKRVHTLGAFPLPVEVVSFGLTATRNMVEQFAADVGCEGPVVLRLGQGGKPFTTDSGHLILDCSFGRIGDPEALDDALKFVPGVVENGLFLGLADAAIVAGPDGVETLEAKEDIEAPERAERAEK